jgi:hypothetical protein
MSPSSSSSSSPSEERSSSIATLRYKAKEHLESMRGSDSKVPVEILI